MPIVSCKHQSTGCNPELFKLFQEEAREILDYIQETLLELTQPIVLLEFPNLTIALAIDFMRILQSDAADLDIIEVQISAYRLEILLSSIQTKKVVEINEVQAGESAMREPASQQSSQGEDTVSELGSDTLAVRGEATSPHASSISDPRSAFLRRSTLDSKLKRDLLEAGEALKLSLLPYLNTDRAARARVPIETLSSFVCKDSKLDSTQTIGIESFTLDDLKILEDIENIHPGSSELTLPTANLLVWLVGSDIFTIPYDRIEANLMPKAEQIIQTGGQDFLQWQQQTIPIYRLSELLKGFPLPELNSDSTRSTVFFSEMKLILIIKQGQQPIALESALERLVTQPELIIQPIAHTLSYCYGFSWWEQWSRVRVINVAALLEQIW